MPIDRRLTSLSRILKSERPTNQTDMSILDLPKKLQDEIINKLNSSLPQQSLNMKNAQNKTAIVKRMLQQQSSSPDLSLIKNLQKRTLATNHPMFRLSIENYEMMCNDNNKLSIMARLFDTNIKKLKKICKNIHIFKEYINSSPEIIKNKMKAYNMSILDLPKDLQIKITKMFNSILPTNYVLRSWVLNNKRFKIEIKTLSENPNAIDYLTENPDLIDWRYLSRNPKAIKLLEMKIKEENKLTEAEFNLLSNKDKISWLDLSDNPKAKKLLEAKFEKEALLEEYDLAQGIRRDTFLYLNWRRLSANPCAIDLLRKNIGKIDWKQLAINPNQEAVELLSLPENIERLEWEGVPPKNSNFNTELFNVNETQNNINWSILSLSRNENTMKLLEKRAAYENTLSDDEYKIIRQPNKINWYFLAINPAIFI
jgi:hypothetical protein